MLHAVGALMAGLTLVFAGLAPVGRISAQQRRLATLVCGAIVVQFTIMGPKLPEHPWIPPTLSVLLVFGGGLNVMRGLELFRRRRADEHFDPEAAIDAGQDGLGMIREFDRNGKVRELNRGVEQLRHAVRASAGESQRTVYAANLVMALRGRYERSRDPADLDEAIEVARGATRTESPDNPRRGGLLAQLSSALRVRYDHFGDSGDLKAALAAGRQAVKAAPPGHDDHAMCLSELSAVRVSQYERTRHPRHLDAAIDALERAHRETVAARVVRTVNLTTLCLLLVRRGNDDDLRRAVDVGGQAVRQVKPGYRLFELAHDNLALALRLRYERTRDPADLDEAVRFARLAADSAAADDPARATHLANLAMALRLAGNPTEALEQARSAATTPATDVVTKVNAGLVWSEIAASAGEYALAVEAFEHVIELLPRVASRALRRSDQEHQLGRWAGIAVTAAACAVADGRPEHAVTLLEQGRGVLLSRALDARVDLRQLRTRHPGLAEEFERLRDALEPTPGFGDDVPNHDWTGRRDLAARWDDVLERIRAEFPAFARPPGLPDLLAQSDDGPIVCLTVSEYRSDALVIENRGVRMVELPGLTPESVAGQVRRLTTTVDPASQRELLDVIDWLRRTVTEPVLDTFRHAPPRIWWVPTGASALLPIHAAALDRTVSSYAPTVRALADARSRTLSGRPGSPLVIAMAETPGAEPLPNARTEADIVRTLFTRARVLTNREASRKRVVAALRGSAWAHFACHARMDPASPSRGRLLLQDGPLTVLDVSALELPDAELAFLSACETAHPGALPDEVITLASAFQLAGFPHVIATPWPVLDKTAPDYADAVYRLLEEGESPAAAVHHATRDARDKYPSLPALWAGHVHVGP